MPLMFDAMHPFDGQARIVVSACDNLVTTAAEVSELPWSKFVTLTKACGPERLWASDREPDLTALSDPGRPGFQATQFPGLVVTTWHVSAGVHVWRGERSGPSDPATQRPSEGQPRHVCPWRFGTLKPEALHLTVTMWHLCAGVRVWRGGRAGRGDQGRPRCLFGGAARERHRALHSAAGGGRGGRQPQARAHSL